MCSFEDVDRLTDRVAVLVARVRLALVDVNVCQLNVNRTNAPEEAKVMVLKSAGVTNVYSVTKLNRTLKAKTGHSEPYCLRQSVVQKRGRFDVKRHGLLEVLDALLPTIRDVTRVDTLRNR